jgi:hypothetical protein
VDVLVSHSAGSFLGFRAAAEIDRIISAAFLNFIGGKPHRYIHHTYIYISLVFLMIE